MRRVVVLLALVLYVTDPWRADGAVMGTVLELTDANFDEEVAKGPTLVVVSADWCTYVDFVFRCRIPCFWYYDLTFPSTPPPPTNRHCKALAPTWSSLAKELSGEITVASVNGPRHKALLKRLKVTAYPTILFLRDGTMREYDGGKRTLAALAEFSRGGYKDTSPVPWYRAPNSFVGKVTGALFRVPIEAEQMYRRIKKNQNLSDVTILFLGLSVPVAFGVFAVAVADVYVTRTARHAGALRRQREAAAGGGGAPHNHAHHD